jgi:hypothetical protein
MAIVVLVLWLFTAGAGFSLLVSSNLGRSRPASATPAATTPLAAEAPSVTPVAASAPAAAASAPAAAASAPAAAASAPAGTAAASAGAPPSVSVASIAMSATPNPPAASATLADPSSPAARAPAASKRELRRAARSQFDPASLTAARQAPMVPGLRSLLEFAHPALAITGLAFWLGFTLVHDRALGWIAFGLVTATICLGLTWFAANTRAARRGQNGRDQNGRDQNGRDRDEPAPSFGIRLVVLHGGGAAVTFVLAALTALVLSH